MKTYSVWNGDLGWEATGLPYDEAFKLYKKLCKASVLDFEDDVGYEAMDADEPELYEVKLVQDIAHSLPVPIDTPEDEPTEDSNGNPITYFKWHQETPVLTDELKVPDFIYDYIKTSKESKYSLLESMTKWTADEDTRDWIATNDITYAKAWMAYPDIERDPYWDITPIIYKDV